MRFFTSASSFVTNDGSPSRSWPWPPDSEVLNSDAEIYGGSNVGNHGRVVAEPLRSHDWDHSLAVTLPPLGFLLLASSAES